MGVLKTTGNIEYRGSQSRRKESEERPRNMRETVKLISSEGFEFVIDRDAAMVSQTIRSMLTSPGGFSESKDGVVTFPDIGTTILEKICQYFYWSLQYSRSITTSCSSLISRTWLCRLY